MPLYLIAINIFVLPAAVAGLLTFNGTGDPDLYVLSISLHEGASFVSLFTFIGGFSAATAMVIVASVALGIMVSNDMVLPIFLRQKLLGTPSQRADFAKTLLHIRRTAIFGVMLLGYVYFRTADGSTGLASIGLLSFSAIAQIAPAMFGGLLWRRANARGAIAGLASGFFVWAYLQFLPSLGTTDHSWIASAVLGFLFPGFSMFSGEAVDNFVNVTIFSLLVNTLAFIIGSLSRNPRPVERIQSSVFIKRQLRSNIADRGWKTSVTVGELKSAISRYLGTERMQRSFRSYEMKVGKKLDDNSLADMAFIHFSEQLLGSAIGSSSARLVLSLILQKAEDSSADTVWLLDQASEALQYNQDMLQTALSQMDQGIAVFDASDRLTIWNRRFRNLLDLPEHVGQVGFPLSDIIAILARRGDVRNDDEEALAKIFHQFDHPFQMVLGAGQRILEVRCNLMPDQGLVATFTDITAQVAADQALKQANETLEQRVSERTAELTRVNHALAEARASADEANLSKTRFFAAAGHDILQPLNAARLYSSSLVERLGASENSALVRTIDSALESVEIILGAVLDISRLDTGAMKPRFTTVPLQGLLERIETDFQPVAREKDLELVIMPTSLSVRSDPNLLRRLVQNLVSNAIKYTPAGRVIIGARRQGSDVVIQVTDSGIGIPASKVKTVFKEFARLEEGMRTASGLGLGLSIVDRISRVLNHRVEISSRPGKGTTFKVVMPLDLSKPATRKGNTVTSIDRNAIPLQGFRVLCIDNEPKILEGMQLLISGWGCEVTCVGSIEEMDHLIAEKKDPPDLAIVDYHLGDGSGIGAVLRLRAVYGAEIPALLITADRTADVRAEAERQNIALQNKPVKPAAMRAFITQVSSRKQAAE